MPCSSLYHLKRLLAERHRQRGRTIGGGKGHGSHLAGIKTWWKGKIYQKGGPSLNLDHQLFKLQIQSLRRSSLARILEQASQGLTGNQCFRGAPG